MSAPRYDSIGRRYATTRREDPRLRARLLSALGDSRTVVNVGAGAGSYEPRDLHILAIEPSDVMAAQRPLDLAPALRGSAAPLPLRDLSVDAAMAILTIHHWDDQLEAGIGELRRVARGPVVIVTFDPTVSATMWLLRDYLPEAAALDHETFPTIDRLATCSEEPSRSRQSSPPVTHPIGRSRRSGRTPNASSTKRPATRPPRSRA